MPKKNEGAGASCGRVCMNFNPKIDEHVYIHSRLEELAPLVGAGSLGEAALKVLAAYIDLAFVDESVNTSLARQRKLARYQAVMGGQPSEPAPTPHRSPENLTAAPQEQEELKSADRRKGALKLNFDD